MGSIESQPTGDAEGSAAAPSVEAELAKLRVELERLRLKGEIVTMQGGLRPWWRQGRSITATIGFIAAIIPITTAVKGFFDERATREAASRNRAQEARDRYLDTVLKEPKNAQLVLRYIVSTSEDAQVVKWAKLEEQYFAAASPLNKKDREKRVALYQEATHVVAALAGNTDPAQEDRFWQLYSVELLGLESPEFEALMVRAGRILKTCKDSPSSCARSELSNLGIQMSHRTQYESQVEALVQPGAPASTTASH